MKIYDIKNDELFCLYNDYIEEENTASIYDNACCIIENENDTLSGADYLYADFLSWLQKKQSFTDDEVGIFVNVHGDYIYGNIVNSLTSEMNK